MCVTANTRTPRPHRTPHNHPHDPPLIVLFIIYRPACGLRRGEKRNWRTGETESRETGDDSDLAFTRYCFTSRLYCTIIFFANTPFIVQYIAQYYQLLHPPAKV